MRYLEQMKELATNLNESTDRITLEPLAFKNPCCNTHESVALEADGRIQFWDTVSLLGWLSIKKIHPLTRRELSRYESNYVNHYHDCLVFEKDHDYDENELCTKLIINEGNICNDELLAARALLTPRNFAKHFRDFSPIDDDLHFERTQAESCLKRSSLGKWLIRHSAYNRPAKEHCELLKLLGIQYFAISFNVMKDGKKVIKHLLILHRPGWGWAKITDVEYTNKTVKPVFMGNTKRYYVCFLDLLLRIVKMCELRFADQISDYIEF